MLQQPMKEKLHALKLQGMIEALEHQEQDETPRNNHDDEFPQCDETLSSDTLKPTNDCVGTLLSVKQTASR
jgi:hypothetical protein